LWLQVYVPAAKQRVLHMLNLPQQLLSVVSADPCSQLHVGWTSLAPDELQAYLEKQQQQDSRAWVRIMGFRATGETQEGWGGQLALLLPCYACSTAKKAWSDAWQASNSKGCVRTYNGKLVLSCLCCKPCVDNCLLSI
jgi:hypothetical protein